MIKKLLLFSILLIASCNDIDYKQYVIENGGFDAALQKAKNENKYLWVALGSEKDCGYTLPFLKSLASNGLFEKYKDKFIFYVVNIESGDPDRFYSFILMPPSIPNSYVFDNEGRIVSLFTEWNANSDGVDVQLESVINGNAINPQTHRNYSVAGTRLINYLNILIEANKQYVKAENDSLKLKESLRLVQLTTEMNRCFYNTYLEAMIYRKLNDTVLLDSCATLALNYLEKGNNSVYFDNLQDSIKESSSVYRNNVKHLANLVFDSTEIHCGKLVLGKVTDFKLQFENKGDQSLVLLNTYTSCDCVTVTFPKKPIGKGERAEVLFKFDAKVKGFFSKNISFRSNASNSVQNVLLKGHVE